MVFPLWKTTAIRQKYESQIVLHAHQPNFFFFFFLKLNCFENIFVPKSLVRFKATDSMAMFGPPKIGQI